MEYIDPRCYDKPVLGQDGCVYEYRDNKWIKTYISKNGKNM